MLKINKSTYDLIHLDNESLLDLKGKSNVIEVIIPNSISGFKESTGEILIASIINNDYSVYNDKSYNKEYQIVLLSNSQFFKKLEIGVIILVENKSNSELPVISYRWLDFVIKNSTKNQFSLDDYLF